MKWITIDHKDNNTLPKEGVEVFFDGGESPPSWGRIKYKGKYPSVCVQESSGEENFYPIRDYTRWLDESTPQMRTEQEIRDAMTEMERMALKAKDTLNTPRVQQSPFLIRKFELWEHRCQARANILKWVLDEPYQTDEQIEVNL